MCNVYNVYCTHALKNLLLLLESKVFECFVRWVQHDELNRLQFVTQLASSIWLQLIPVKVKDDFGIDCSS